MLFSYDANGSVVSVNFNGTDYYYVRNGQGDIIKLLDGSGATVTEYTYDTWGKLLSCTRSLSSALGVQNPFRYRGYVYDTETGWYYLQSRYYDPEVGRFLSADVLLSTGQGVLGHNTFAYCLNNPVNMSDSSGTIPWWLLLLLLVSVAASNGCAGNVDQADNDSSQGSHGIDTEYNGNCYQYATGTTYSILGGGCFFPGYTTGHCDTDRFSDAGTLATCIQSDLNACYKRRKRRFSVEPCEANYEPEGNQWKIAYCYGDDDFHFFRYDTNVGWTHKPGWDAEVTSNDFAGNPISDLSSADLGRYNADTLIYLVIKEVQYE